MAEATYLQDPCTLDYTPAAADLTGGQVIQLADGRAAVAKRDVVTGVLGALQTSGLFTVQKTTNIVILDGGKVFWDHSADKAHFKTVNDRDFYLGTAVGDASASATTMVVNLNVHPVYLLDVARDPCTTAITGTAAAEGFGRPKRIGGSTKFLVTATNEAQKVDLLSNQGFATGANAIVEGRINVISDGAGTATDVSVGVANATHATDADSITDSIFVHLDGNAADIKLESDDGTVEVAATDSTVDYTEGTPFEFWIDMRNPADVQIYIDGVLALGSTVFNVSASVATWKLLTHVEKTSSTDTYEIDVEWLRARIAEQ